MLLSKVSLAAHSLRACVFVCLPSDNIRRMLLGSESAFGWKSCGRHSLAGATLERQLPSMGKIGDPPLKKTDASAASVVSLATCQAKPDRLSEECDRQGCKASRERFAEGTLLEGSKTMLGSDIMPCSFESKLLLEPSAQARRWESDTP